MSNILVCLFMKSIQIRAGKWLRKPRFLAILSATKKLPNDSSFRKYKAYADIHGVPRAGASNDSGVGNVRDKTSNITWRYASIVGLQLIAKLMT